MQGSGDDARPIDAVPLEAVSADAGPIAPDPVDTDPVDAGPADPGLVEVPVGVDPTQPSVARVYDYYLGGSHNFESDRVFAQRVLAQLPDMAMVAQENRAFLRRAVAHLCALGIDQFLDLGSGIPTVGNVHEIVLATNPDAAVIYVDHDPVAVTHSRELLKDVPGADVIGGDLRDVRAILDHPLVRERIDLTRPLAVLLVSVLHFVSDDDDPADVVARYLAAAAPGSHVVISHASEEGRPDASGAQAVYNQGRSPNRMRMRTGAEVTALFGGLPLLEPGVVRIPLWRPESPDDVRPGADRYPGVAGLARKG